MIFDNARLNSASHVANGRNILRSTNSESGLYRVRATAIGAGLGLAWALALRSWMTHLAIQFNDWPRFTWEGTFLAVLLPATLVGGLISWDFASRLDSGRGRRWVQWSPLLLAVGPALVAEDFVGTLMSTGEGSGALGVVFIGLCGGFAISKASRPWVRWTTGLIALGVTGVMTYVLYLGEPPVTSSDAFGALFLVVLMLGLAIGCSVPTREWWPAGNPVENVHAETR